MLVGVNVSESWLDKASMVFNCTLQEKHRYGTKISVTQQLKFLSQNSFGTESEEKIFRRKYARRNSFRTEFFSPSQV